jgi:hypothetical protein
MILRSRSVAIQPVTISHDVGSTVRSITGVSAPPPWGLRTSAWRLRDSRYLSHRDAASAELDAGSVRGE